MCCSHSARSAGVLQDLDAALAHYDRAIAVAPRSFVARLARAAVLMDLGRHEAALADIEFLRAQRPDDPNVAYLQALALVRDSKVSEGRELLRGVANSLDRLDAADLRSHPPNVLINGVAHYALGHFENAERNLNRHYPDDLQDCGDHTPVPPSRELYSLCSHPMA